MSKLDRFPTQEDAREQELETGNQNKGESSRERNCERTVRRTVTRTVKKTAKELCTVKESYSQT